MGNKNKDRFHETGREGEVLAGNGYLFFILFFIYKVCDLWRD